MSRAVERTPFVLDSVFDIDADSDEPLLGSNEEASFLKAWVPMTLGPCAGHWFTPQAPLDKLIESGGMGDGSGARRCDFLFSHPGGPPVVIEIDGPEHDAAVDDARDESLRSVGIDVLRVTNAEVMRGHGPMLDRIRAHCHAALTAFLPVTGEDRVASSLAFDCATAAKVQLAIARAVEYGWLTAGANWEIYISGAGSSSVAGVLDTITLLAGFDVLYAGHSLPATCTVCTEDQFSITWMYSDQGEWVVTTASKTPDNRVRIAVESATSPFHAIPREGKSDFVIRPAFLPALLATEQGFDINRRSIATKTYPEARSLRRRKPGQG